MGKSKKKGESCAVCNKIVTGMEKSIGCEGWCQKWHHCDCIGMTDEQYKLIIELDDKVMWMCDFDKQLMGKYGEFLKDSLEVTQKVDVIMAEMRALKTQVEKLEKNDENIMKNALEYEVKVVNEIKKVAGDKNETYASKVKNDPAIIVKPKKKQENKVTMELLKEKIDPAAIRIVKVANRHNGAIALMSKDNNSNRVKEMIEEELGDKYDIEINELRKPRLFIHGFTDKLNEEELIAKIKVQNDQCKNADLKCIKILESKKGKSFNAVIEVESKDFYNILESGKINIGWERCSVYDDVGVKRCYKCQGFNHMAKECRNKAVCVKCTGEHENKGIK